ncbi:hypothetical protein BC833DRAFT_575887 [Globomyces pollinis-pini]|nr:hypothetical protein BC833DRAFT_575887 [Globomyces pollinis-pini]
MSQLKKHNLFLQHNYTPKVPKQKEMLSTASVPPTTTECTEMRKDLEFVVSRLGELSQQNQSIMEEYRMKLHDYTSQFETDQLDIHELYQEIIETYKANETRLQSQLETLSSVFKTTNGSIPTDKALELKLHQFTRDTMLHLEKDRCSLIAKCAALEEELSNQ